jgi:hypothetical protein
VPISCSSKTSANKRICQSRSPPFELSKQLLLKANMIASCQRRLSKPILKLSGDRKNSQRALKDQIRPTPIRRSCTSE